MSMNHCAGETGIQLVGPWEAREPIFRYLVRARSTGTPAMSTESIGTCVSSRFRLKMKKTIDNISSEISATNRPRGVILTRLV